MARERKISLPKVIGDTLTAQEARQLLDAAREMQRDISGLEQTIKLAEYKIDELSNVTRAIEVTGRLVKGIATALAVSVIMGIVTLIQGHTRQEAIRRDVDMQRSDLREIEQNIRSIELSVSTHGPRIDQVRTEIKALRDKNDQILDAVNELRPRWRRR